MIKKGKPVKELPPAANAAFIMPECFYSEQTVNYTLVCVKRLKANLDG